MHELRNGSWVLALLNVGLQKKGSMAWLLA